jgi:hypothetical protein
MNRSYSKIRHIQEVNKKLEDRRLSLLTEQVDVSGYQGSGTDVRKVGDEVDSDMSGIKVTRDEGEIKRKGMSPNDPIYKKIEDFFQRKYNLPINMIEEPINKSVQPLVYEVQFYPKDTKNYEYVPFEITIEDMESTEPKVIENIEKRFKGLKDKIATEKPKQTFRT